LPYKYRGDGITFGLTEGPDVCFNYEHPFRVSAISPQLNYLYAHQQKIDVKDENVVVFGMLDAKFHVEAERAVYDPQTAVMPELFSKCSKAKQLVYVLNMTEAKSLSGANNIDDIKVFFFDKEKCYALIIKNGAKGAILYQHKDDQGILIPVYKTNHVFTIGSGDIFTSTFSYFWFHGIDLETSALNASKSAACYSESSGDIDKIPAFLDNFDFPALIPSKEYKQIYLAGPFFSFGQKWIVNEFYFALKSEGMRVFSPLHDVGIGEPNEVVPLDLNGLNNSDIVLAILDGVDAGTVFEVGYAIAKGKKVVVYVENTNPNSLTMLKGTHCDLENDFTTAVFKACWYAAE
jgi:nucleoside 2-deoxyribosyltransferase